MRKKHIVLGILFSILLVVLGVIYGIIYSMPIWTEGLGLLSALVLFLTLFFAEWHFIKAGIVPKWIKYIMYFRWCGAAFVFLITMIYFIVKSIE